MITANYIFKEAIMTQGMKFYKTKSLESQKNINTYEDFINYIVAQNFGRYFFQIIYDEAIRTQKTYDEILERLDKKLDCKKQIMTICWKKNLKSLNLFLKQNF